MLASVLVGLASLVNFILNMVTILIIISVFISWLNADPYNAYVQMIRRITEPLYRPVRKLTERISGPLDLAPMIVMFVIIFLQKVIPHFLLSLSTKL